MGLCEFASVRVESRGSGGRRGKCWKYVEVLFAEMMDYDLATSYLCKRLSLL